jgi:peptidyl-prolyl cis-trans isomerase D
MLDALRVATKGWFGRSLMIIVMGFLILSFAIWGIGDVFRGFTADQLAKIGKVEIDTETYRNAYQTELQRLQRQSRRAITNDEARQLGIDRQVLARLVSEAALDQEIDALALAISDQEVARKIANDEAFKNAAGAFDRQRFNAILRDNGYTEQSYIREQRAQYLRHQVTDALVHSLALPNALLEAIHRFQAESRKVDYMVIPVSDAGAVAAPSNEELQKYFEARRAAYASPEYRSLVTLVLTPAKIAKPDEVSDEDAKKRYEELKTERFGTPEKRALEQIFFNDRAEAEAARARLDKDLTWEQLLAELKITQQDASLGTLARTGIADKNVADAAFSLAEGKISQPVKSQFGTVIVRVTKIEPASTKPYSEVAADLKKELALQRARGEVARLHDAIEDERASGKSLSEAAQSVGLETRAISAIDATGKDPQSYPVPDLEDAKHLLKAAFASDIGVDNDTLRIPDGGYQWFEVTKIEPAHEKTFDQLRQDVEKAWREDETAKILSAKAAELAKRLEAGEPIAAVAASAGNLEVKHLEGVKRGFNEAVAPDVATQIFNVGVGGAGSVRQDDGSRLLFYVVDSVTPPFNASDPTLTAISGEIRNGMSEDVVAQYLTKLQNDLGIEVNAKAFAAATGAASTY